MALAGPGSVLFFASPLLYPLPPELPYSGHRLHLSVTLQQFLPTTDESPFCSHLLAPENALLSQPMLQPGGEKAGGRQTKNIPSNLQYE